MGDYVLPKVKAKYAYQRQNEDELSFEKGAIIQLITKDDGGWYEGKYNGKIGWFPSNFVREIKVKKTDAERSVSPGSSQKGTIKDDNVQSQETKQSFYLQVLQNFLETEWAYVKEIQSLLIKFVRPMSPTDQSDILSKSDFKTLCGNLEKIFDFQTKFVREVEENSKLPYQQQQVGQCFMKYSETFESFFQDYCGNHPSAVTVIQGNKEALTKYMEDKGANAPGSVSLTSGLSKPFRRLERYPSILRELERHIMETHNDRVYLTKAVLAFEKILLICEDTRKRKETEQHILSSTISNWEGEPLSSLGKVLYLSSAMCLIGNDERKERHLLLFSSALLILSASPRLSGFSYEGSLPLTVLQTKKLDDCPAYQHAFEITSSLIERIVVITKSAEEQRCWLRTLEAQCEKYRRTSHAPVAATATPSPIVKQAPVTQIPPPPKHATGTRASPGSHYQSGASRPANYNRQMELIQQISPTVSPPPFPSTGDASSVHAGSDKTWCQMCLRPSAPSRHINIGNGRESSALNSRNRERSRSPKGKPRKRKNNKFERKISDVDENSMSNEKILFDKGRLEEEREILSVLDLYCTTAAIRSTLHSVIQGKTRHTSILEEKIIDDDPENGGLPGEKSLVDTVYDLKDQVQALKQDQKKMLQSLEDETKARKRLEALIRRAAAQADSVSPSTSRSSSIKEAGRTQKR